MSTDFTLDAQPRDDKGKGASRRLRHAGLLPAILYGAGSEPTMIALKQNEVFHSLENEAFYSHILTVNVAGKKEQAILRDLQRHPSKPIVLHMDLQRVKADEEIRVHVPLHFKGEDIAPGIKTEGGTVSHLLLEVDVSCLPKDLPEFIEVDISDLHLNESLHLSDLKLPKGVTLVELQHGEEHDNAVVNIHPTRVTAVEDETLEAAAEEDAEKPAEEGGEG